MENICNSCGGVLGRDCFNPRECAQITQSMRYEQFPQYDLNTEIAHLESVNAELLEALKSILDMIINDAEESDFIDSMTKAKTAIDNAENK